MTFLGITFLSCVQHKLKSSKLSTFGCKNEEQKHVYSCLFNKQVEMPTLDKNQEEELQCIVESEKMPDHKSDTDSVFNDASTVSSERKKMETFSISSDIPSGSKVISVSPL